MKEHESLVSLRCFWRVVSSAQMKAMLSFSWKFGPNKNGNFHRRCMYKEQQLSGVLCFVVVVLKYEFLSMKQRRMIQLFSGCCKKPVEWHSLAFVSPPTQTEISLFCKTLSYLKARNFPQNGFMEASDFQQKMFSLQGQSMSVLTMCACVCVCVLEISRVHKPSAPVVISNISDSDCLVWFTKLPTEINPRHC